MQAKKDSSPLRFTQEIIELDSWQHAIRLTKNPQDKVVKIEIYANDEEQHEIFNFFPNKNIEWAEAASHFLVLKGIASYQNDKLLEDKPQQWKHPNTLDTPIKLTADSLTDLIKELSQATAPLYAFINNPDLDNNDHPAHQAWKAFRIKNNELEYCTAKVEFLSENINNYKNKITQIFSKYTLNESLQAFERYHIGCISQFQTQLKDVKKLANKRQVYKLFNHQDQLGGPPSLGEFLRSQAHTMMAYAISSIDEITAARFNQLFAFSAHPLRKKFAEVKSALAKQQTTYAIRPINTSSPFPEGQLAAIANKPAKQTPLSIHPNKKWMNVTPFINAKTSQDGGVEGAEGLEDVDKILCVYLGATNALQKKPSWPYRVLNGEYGALSILGAILLGLPAAILGATALVAGVCIAMAVDLVVFLLQGLVIAVSCPLLLAGCFADIILLLPTLITQKTELEFSFLGLLARLPIPPPGFNEIFRKFSLVRIFKQFLLEKYSYYSAVKIPPEIFEKKNQIIDQVKKNQAEGFFNAIGTKIFSFSTIALFLQQKIKQIFYALRELRKVFSLGYEKLDRWLQNESPEDMYKEVINKLEDSIKLRNKQIADDFIKSFEALTQKDLPTQNLAASQETISSMEKIQAHYTNQQWTTVAPLKTKQYETPLDFVSDIGLGLVHQLVDPAFEHNPGIATPTFVAAMVCLGALTFPTIDNLLPNQVVKGFQFIPQILAKAFMGKYLDAGLSSFATNIISAFLQWKLSYFGTEGLIAISRGDIGWIQKTFEKPEEITFGALLFIAMGYATSFIPKLPPHLLILKDNSSAFLNIFATYADALYHGLAEFVNAVVDESAEVIAHAAIGANTLELGFIGLKSAMLVYGLLSGTHYENIRCLTLDTQKLHEDFQNENLFDASLSEEVKKSIIQNILKGHDIEDKESVIAQSIFDQLLKINQVSEAISTSTKPSETEEKGGLIPLASPKTGTKVWSGEEQSFIAARKELIALLKIIHNLEILGMPINMSVQTSAENDYRSKVDAEQIYDALCYKIAAHNKHAKKLGFYSEVLDADNFLHNFYNKHCYAGSSGLHKFIFGILLFPLTWIWRGFKYLIGPPSMKKQVKKSFCKDFAMFLQLIPDVIAPILRSLTKAILYTFRMFLGTPILIPLIVACIMELFMLTIGLLLLIPATISAIVTGLQKGEAKAFTAEIKTYFCDLKKVMQTIWGIIMCSKFVNGYIATVSLLGSISGTRSPHRLNLLKTFGIAQIYQALTQEADTNSDNLCKSTYDLIVQLNKEPESLLQDPNPLLAKLAQHGEKESNWFGDEEEAQMEKMSSSLLAKQSEAFKSVLDTVHNNSQLFTSLTSKPMPEISTRKEEPTHESCCIF